MGTTLYLVKTKNSLYPVRRVGHEWHILIKGRWYPIGLFGLKPATEVKKGKDIEKKPIMFEDGKKTNHTSDVEEVYEKVA